jgi:hypothetical protein
MMRLDGCNAKKHEKFEYVYISQSLISSCNAKTIPYQQPTPHLQTLLELPWRIFFKIPPTLDFGKSNFRKDQNL